jgi:hypothetical protein
MTYTIALIQDDHKDKNGLQKIKVRVVFNRRKAYATIPINVTAEEQHFVR